MPPHFLTIRLSYALLGADAAGDPDHVIDPQLTHVKKASAFYEVDSQAIADKLLDLFRYGAPDPGIVTDPANANAAVGSMENLKKVVDAACHPIYDVVDAAKMNFAERVICQQHIQTLERMGDCDGDPGIRADAGLPNDRRTVLVWQEYEKARQWEPLVREQLGVGDGSRTATKPPSSPLPDNRARTDGQTIYLWFTYCAIVPLDGDMNAKFYFHKTESSDLAARLCEMFQESQGEKLWFNCTPAGELGVGLAVLADEQIAKYRSGQVVGMDADFGHQAVRWEQGIRKRLGLPPDGQAAPGRGETGRDAASDEKPNETPPSGVANSNGPLSGICPPGYPRQTPDGYWLVAAGACPVAGSFWPFFDPTAAPPAPHQDRKTAVNGCGFLVEQAGFVESHWDHPVTADWLAYTSALEMAIFRAACAVGSYAPLAGLQPTECEKIKSGVLAITQGLRAYRQSCAIVHEAAGGKFPDCPDPGHSDLHDQRDAVAAQGDDKLAAMLGGLAAANPFRQGTTTPAELEATGIPREALTKEPWCIPPDRLGSREPMHGVCYAALEEMRPPLWWLLSKEGALTAGPPGEPPRGKAKVTNETPSGARNGLAGEVKTDRQLRADRLQRSRAAMETLEREAGRAQAAVDVTGLLKTLIQEIEMWAKDLKPNTLDLFEDSDDAKHLRAMLRGDGSRIGFRPAFILIEFVTATAVCDLLELTDQEPQARSLARRLEQLRVLRAQFGDFVANAAAHWDEPKGDAPEVLFAVDEHRKSLKLASLDLCYFIQTMIQVLGKGQAEGGISRSATPAIATPPASVTEPRDPPGGPFFKPSHFRQWGIGDELLRRNATDGEVYVEGKVRRRKRSAGMADAKSVASARSTGKKSKRPSAPKGRSRPSYGYSESDARRCWPEKFAAIENRPRKAT